MQLDLSTEQLQQIVSGAILSHISEDKRTELMQKAIEEHLLKPAEGSYGRKGNTPLQDAFNQACFHVCRDLIKEELEKPEQKKALEELCERSVKQVLRDEENSIHAKMTSAFIEALTRGY